MAGKIEARSEEGRGTTFILRLPTNANQTTIASREQEFLQKVLLSETLWEKLITAE